MSKTDRLRDLERELESVKNVDEGLDAVAAARDLRAAADRWERAQIRAARSQGVSWSKIGALYGLSKQGAQQRFAKRGKAEPPVDDEIDS